MKNPSIKIRKIQICEYPLIKEFTYHAIYVEDPSFVLPRSVLNEPENKNYYEGFGLPDDLAMVAENADGMIVGAVWTRILAGEIKGFGNIDNETPEFGISVLPQYRKLGIGTELLKEMLILLKNKGYEKCSLAVQKKNYAVKMYENCGFNIVDENDQEYIMLHRF